MHGRNTFEFSADERKQLRTYIERGGMLFADAICSQQEFADCLPHEMELIFPDMKLAADSRRRIRCSRRNSAAST